MKKRYQSFKVWAVVAVSGLLGFMGVGVTPALAVDPTPVAFPDFADLIAVDDMKTAAWGLVATILLAAFIVGGGKVYAIMAYHWFTKKLARG